VLLRKGGIREPRFSVDQRTFALFPTGFHSSAALVRPDALRALVPLLPGGDVMWDPKQAEQIPIASFAEVRCG